MVGADQEMIRRLIAENVIKGPVLELGTGYGGATSRDDIIKAELRHVGTDLVPGLGVDYPADFEKLSDLKAIQAAGPFATVLILNVLEHTFDPIRILDNARTLLAPAGILVTITPAIWPLHNFPMDAWRILPNFYEEYAKRRGLKLFQDYFEYVGVGPVTRFRNLDGSYTFPPPHKPGLRYNLSRAIHKVFNTFGRGMSHPSHASVVAIFQDPRAA